MDNYNKIKGIINKKFKGKLRNILSEDRAINIDDVLNECYCWCIKEGFSEDSINKCLNKMRSKSRKNCNSRLREDLVCDEIVIEDDSIEYDERLEDAKELSLTEEECLAIMYMDDKKIKRSKQYDFSFMDRKGNQRGIDYVKTGLIYEGIIKKLRDYIKYELS